MPRDTDQLKLRRFRIEGFKALDPVDVFIDGPAFFLIGANGAGKSSILQALSFVQYFATGHSLQFFRDRRWDPKQIRSRTSQRRAKPLTLEFNLETKRYQIYWRFSWSLTRHCLMRESVWVRRGQDEPEKVFQYSNTPLSKQMSKAGSWSELVLEGSAMAVIRPGALSKKHSDLLQCLQKWGEGVTSLELLSPISMRSGARGYPHDIGLRGERLAAFLAGLSSEQKGKVVKRVSRFYPLRGFDTTRKRAGWVDLQIAEAFKGLPGFSAAHMSDGFLRILALCAIPEFSNDVSLVLLDEVEDGIEPHNLPRLIQQIIDESSAQIAMASHSPLLVNFFDPEQIYFLAREPTGRTVAVPSDQIQVFKTGAEYLGSGEIWANTDLKGIEKEAVKIVRAKEAAGETSSPNRAISFMAGQ